MQPLYTPVGRAGGAAGVPPRQLRAAHGPGQGRRRSRSSTPATSSARRTWCSNGSEDGQARTLLFTADVGRYDTPILRDPAPLPGPGRSGHHREHLRQRQATARSSEVEPAAARRREGSASRNRSRLLVPSFAVGRTQTILWYVQKFISEKQIPPIPVFVDSPMGVEASQVYSKFRENYDDQTTR